MHTPLPGMVHHPGSNLYKPTYHPEEASPPSFSCHTERSKQNSFMKHGLSRQQVNYPRPGMHYWNEYVFEGYVNHQDDMIMLAGYPDTPLSRPHSRESQALPGE
ncbi:MAG: hypothetical protein ABSG91_19290 [Syntrophobacteraceae bacterium]|jgi:hypothetical protein